MSRARPKVSNEIVKSFGSNVAPRPLNPSQNQEQTYSAITEMTGCEVPRYILHLLSFLSLFHSLSFSLSLSIDRTVKMYIGGAQKRPDATYSRPVISLKTGKVLCQVGEGNRKDIREAVEAAHKAAPG